MLHSVFLEELLEKSDVVTLHTPHQEETKGLINAYNIEKFKKGAIFINAARGELVESYDLLHAALESGRLGYVALGHPDSGTTRSLTSYLPSPALSLLSPRGRQNGPGTGAYVPHSG